MKMKSILFAGIILYHFRLNSRISYEINKIDDFIVEIENGKIRGTRLTTTHNKIIYGFLEIPYASPPTGKLRFKVRTACNILIYKVR